MGKIQKRAKDNFPDVGDEDVMTKYKLIKVQNLTPTYVPNFFQWHDVPRGRVENMIEDIQSDVETLQQHVRDENWSMVEILAERLGYYFEE